MKNIYSSLRAVLVLSLFFLSVQAHTQCEAGILQTTGTVDVPEGMTFDVMVTDEVAPDTGGFGWLFRNANSNGTGALNGNFILNNSPTMATYDNDLSGVLSNSGFPPMQGTWVVYGASYSDNSPGASFNSICSITADSLVVNFDMLDDTCESGTMTNFGDTVVCKDATFDLEVAGTIIPPGGGFGWLLTNEFTNGAGGLDNPAIIVNAAQMISYNDDLNGIITDNNLQPLTGTWVLYGAVYTNSNDAFNTVCSRSMDSLLVTFNPEITLTLENSLNTSVIATAGGGTPPYSYLWSNGEMTEVATDLSDGDLSLVVTDAEGCEMMASINLMNTSIEDVVGLESFKIFPNPVAGPVNVKLSLEQTSVIHATLLDLSGNSIQKLLNENSSGGNYNFDFSNLSSGVYLINFEVDGVQFVERIFKI